MSSILDRNELEDIHLDIKESQFGNDYDLCFIFLIDDIYEYKQIDREHITEINNCIDRINMMTENTFMKAEVSPVDILMFNSDNFRFNRVNCIEGSDEYLEKHRTVQLRIYIQGKVREREFDRFMKVITECIRKISFFTEMVLCEFEDTDEDTYRDFFSNYEIYDYVTYEQSLFSEYIREPDKYKYRDIIVDGKRGLEVKGATNTKRC